MTGILGNLNASNPWGIVVLVSLFALGAIAFVPRTLMCVGAGIAFGLVAIPLSLLGSTLGAVAAFWLARYLFRAAFERFALKRRKWRAVLQAVDEEGWRIVGLFRLGAPIPATVQNYAFGLTRIGIWPYILATLLGTLPQTILYVYLGAVGRATLTGVSGAGSVTIMSLGAVVMLIVILRVTKRAKITLAKAVPEGRDGASAGI